MIGGINPFRPPEIVQVRPAFNMPGASTTASEVIMRVSNSA
jgi:hypothetical protein